MMSAPIDIVFLVQDLYFGGTQRQILELANRLDRKRFSPAIWTLAGPADLDMMATEAGIPVYYLGLGARPGLGFPLALLRRLLSQRPDILALCTALPNIWGRILGWCARVPVVIGSCRGGGAPKRQHERFLWRLADHMICNSTALHNILCKMGMPSGRVTYIPNGVDTEYFEPGPTPVDQRDPLVLSVGRLVPDKDHMTLLRAFSMVLKRIPDAQLRIVGDGPQEFALRRIIEDPPYKGRVQIVRGAADIRRHYHEARAFALASVREGQPNVILEAMAGALPVVATNVGGIPSLARNCVTGLLSVPSDAVTLAGNLCRLLENPVQCRIMGQAGRALVESEFSLNAMVHAHERLFERLWSLRTEKKAEAV